MAGTPAELRKTQLLIWWFRAFRRHTTDRCVWTPDACRHSI